MPDVDPGPLVSADWLAARLGEPTLRLIHVSVDREVYDVRHLPGAVFSDLHVELARAGLAPDTGDAEREYMLPAREQLAQTLVRWGVGAGERVVFYDDVGQNRQAIRGYWLLRLYGFPSERVHLLDGGIPFWESRGLPLTADVAEPVRATGGASLGEPDSSLLATADDVAAWSAETVAGGPVRLLDVRTVDEYLGRDVRARRGGHVPGARQRLWSDFLTPEGTLRPAEDCLSIVRATGADPAELRATYCQGGVRAALVWFVLHELAGCRGVRSYAGSWEEWGNRLDLPVER